MKYLPDDIDFAAYLDETEHKQTIVHSSEFLQTLKDSYRNKDTSNRIYLPWEKTRCLYHFRPGELTIWAGENSSGKTLVMMQVILSLLGQQQKLCLASLEMTAGETFSRMLRLYSHICFGDEDIQLTHDEIEVLDQTAEDMIGFSQNMWLFHKMGDVTAKSVLGAMRYSIDKFGVGHFMIDNLQKVVSGTDNYNGEKDFVSSIFDIAKDTGCHIHLVHHTKKMEKSGATPDKNDIKGSSSITDIADSAFVVWRNKMKELDVELKGDQSAKMDEPDSFIRCIKQRHYSGSKSGEQTVGLFFDKASTQLKGHQGDQLMEYYKSWPHGVYQ